MNEKIIIKEGEPTEIIKDKVRVTVKKAEDGEMMVCAMLLKEGLFNCGYFKL